MPSPEQAVHAWLGHRSDGTANPVLPKGQHLRVGDTIVTNIVLPPVAVESGQHAVVDFGRLRRVGVRIVLR